MPNAFKPIVNPYRKNKPVSKPTSGTSVPSTASAQIKKQWNPQNKANVKVQQKPSAAKPVTPINRKNVKKSPQQQTSSSITTPVAKVKSTPSASLPSVVRSLPKVTPFKRPPISGNNSRLKKKNSMKKQLKQEITFLKKRKTLASLQAEADRRRRQKQQEKDVKMKELQVIQAERQRLKDEKHRQRMEILKQKEEEKLRKQQEREAERLRKQQEREKKLEEKKLREEQNHLEHCQAYQKYLLQCYQYQQKTMQYRQEQQKYQAEYVEYARMQSQRQAQLRMQAQMAIFHQHQMMAHQGSLHAAVGMMVAPQTHTGNFLAPNPIATGGIHVAPQPNLLSQGSAPAAPAGIVHPSGMIADPPTQAGNLISAQPSTYGMNPALGPTKMPQDSPETVNVATVTSNLHINGKSAQASSQALPPTGAQVPSTVLENAVKPAPVLSSSGSAQAFTSNVAVPRPLQPMVPLQHRLPNNMIVHPALAPHILPSGGMHRNNIMNHHHPHFMGGPYQAPMVAPLAPPPKPPAPLPYPPVPPRGVVRIWKPWRQQQQLRPQARPKPMEVARLCEVTKAPSPFAHYELLEIKLVRPVDEKSFGVSLKLFQQSTLVDPEWYEEQIRKRLGLATPAKTTTTTSATTEIVEPAKAESGSAAPWLAEIVKPTVQNSPTPANLSAAAPQQKMTDESRKEMTEKNVPDANGVEEVVKIETAKIQSPKPTEEKLSSLPSGSPTQENKELGTKTTAAGQSSGETTKGEVSPTPNASSELSMVTPASSNENSSGSLEGATKDAEQKNEPTTASTSSQKDVQEDTMPVEHATSNVRPNAPSADGNVRPTTDLADPKAKDHVSSALTPNNVVSASPAVASKPKKRRRRRVNFAVMLVIDSTKQNGYREKAGPEYGSQLLQPGDIVVSIGGTPLANMTFMQACAIFASKSEKSNDFISAGLMVARRPKPVPKPIVVKSTPKLPSTKIPKAQKLANDPKDMTLANSNLPFQSYEFAAIADSIIRAVHQPSRLLGQRVSTLPALEPMASLLQKIGKLKNYGFEGEGFPVRSVPALQTQWIERSRRIESEFRMKHQAHWTKKIEHEGGFQNVTFSSDAQRSSLRQMPRPVRGCRCGGSDHVYLHDPKCLLYRDVCRLVPKDELSRLLKTEKKISKKKDAGLNAVEKGFKDRLVKLKGIAELEEQEARFVSHMEEVQVKQCNKAVFAPTELSSIILSAVFELQREFPTQFIDEDEDDSDDEEEATLSEVTGDKRAASSNNLPMNKRRKKTIAVPKMVNFRYMLRVLQYISKTWGHVYREPSHEDYAWRWELFHGHNSSQGQWESQAKNPRAPNSLPFEAIQSGNLGVQSASDLSLLRSTVAEFYGSIGREFDGVMKRIEAQKEAEKAASATLSNPIAGEVASAPEVNLSQSSIVDTSEPRPVADIQKADASDVTMACASEAKTTDESATNSKSEPSSEMATKSESTDAKMVDPSMAKESTVDSTVDISANDLSGTTNAVKSPVVAESNDATMVDAPTVTETEATVKPLPDATVSSTVPATATSKVVEKPLTPTTSETTSTLTNPAATQESPSEDKDVKIADASQLAAEKEEKKKPIPPLNINQESADYFLMAAHLLSPSTSGLYDELMALVKMEILKLDPSGIPGPTMDWHTNVDLVVLEDMDRCWGSDADREGRFCINHELRDTLEEKWVKSQYGWAMADDPNDLVFDYDVIDAWREAFQGEMEEQANLAEGVGRYGL